MKGIVGREAEIRELQERYSSDRAQFVAVYGRESWGQVIDSSSGSKT